MPRAATATPGSPVVRATALPRASAGAVWLAAPPALAALVGGFLPIEAIDPWWSLMLGALPPGAPDPIVFTPLVGPTANVQWLAQRLLARLHELGGFGLLLAFRSLVLAASLAIAELIALRTGAGPCRAALAALVILPTVVAGAALRPQLLALPLYALILLVGGALPERRWAPAAVAVVAGAWANVHGSFVLAPLSLALLAVGGPPPLALRRLGLALLAAAAVLANPWGPEVYRAVLDVTRSNGGGASSLALEWRPIDLLSIPGLFFLLQIALVVLGLARGGGRSGLRWLPLLVPLAALAAGSGRHSLWVALAAMPLLASALPRPGGAERHSVIAAPGLAGLALLALFGLAHPFSPSGRQLAPETPVELADRAAASGARRLFAFSDWGGYLAWRLRSGGRVYVDDRFEQRPPERWARYRSISLAEPGWQAALDEAGVDALALDASRQAPLVDAALHSEEWRLVQRDDAQALFVRR